MVDSTRSQRKLDLDPGTVRAAHEAAATVANDLGDVLRGLTTVSIERSIVRLLGVDGVDGHGAPLPMDAALNDSWRYRRGHFTLLESAEICFFPKQSGPSR
jgi:hypothetical protein